MKGNVGDSLIGSIRESFYSAATFLPNFLAGLIILLIGLVVGSIVKRLVLGLFEGLKLESYLNKYGIPEGKKDYSWANIFSEVARWFVIIIFLIPTADVWNLPQITTVLNTFLLYLPNVFVAAIIGMVGLAFARLASDIVMGSARGISPEVANLLASITRWAITIFVVLAVLTQLGVAADLIRILFTGFVAMIALAGGIAFGLGGQDSARAVLDALRRKIK
ncbi:MAG: hypothetical protein HZC02_00255 [Candidatus Levybacteria bacterium]|nr:hypothetical protein [Candidatus Levybacteria bacterium]